MTWRQLWLAPLSLLLAAGCAAAALVSMPPGSYVLAGAAAAFVLAGLCFAEAPHRPQARDVREYVEATNEYHLFNWLSGGRRRTRWQRLLRRMRTHG